METTQQLAKPEENKEKPEMKEEKVIEHIKSTPSPKHPDTKDNKEQAQTDKPKITKPQTPQSPDNKTTDKTPEKKESKKKAAQKKEEAIARGISIRASKKHCVYICSFIKNKKIDKAIEDLTEVIKMKKPIPFKGEIPHRKGMMSGRYPIKASKYFINVLKALKGNAIVNGLDLDKTRIYIASANWASRPARSAGRRAKRTHVLLKAKEIPGGKE